RHVVAAVCEEGAHVRVERHPIAERVGRALGWREEVPLRVLLPRLIHLEAEEAVFAVGAHPDLGAELPVDRRGIRRRDPGEARIRSRPWLRPIGEGIGAGDRHVVEAGDLPLVAEQLARVAEGSDEYLCARPELEWA